MNLIKPVSLSIAIVLASLGQAAVAASTPQLDGYTLWTQQVSSAKGVHSCQSCHGKDLTLMGKHLKTGKAIKPMAVSVNPKRFTDPKKVKKWFRRNCRFAWGRECTSEEKSAILSYLRSQ